MLNTKRPEFNAKGNKLHKITKTTAMEKINEEKRDFIKNWHFAKY